MLREYQQRTIDQLYAWFESGKTGNPCLVLPTGSGKSHIIAALCKDALQSWPETRILMLTHVKELIEQNAEKMRQHWPNAPMGIYSAGLRSKELGEPITFAGIQSVRAKAAQIGHVDLVIIDECFIAGTKISTPKGLIDIDKVRCGDLVYNQSGIGTVEAISCKSTNELYKVEFDNGNNVQCTGNHQFFTNNGWKSARELENGTSLFSQKDMLGLWDNVFPLGEIQRTGEVEISASRTKLEKAKFLLRQVCEEILPNNFERTSQGENQANTQGYEASPYSAWRERGMGWIAEHPIKTYAGHLNGIYPNAYKVDIANLEKMIAIELDGGTHSSIERQNQDKKKDQCLAALGWSVYRVSNQKALNLYSTFKSVDTLLISLMA